MVTVSVTRFSELYLRIFIEATPSTAECTFFNRYFYRYFNF